MDIQPGTQVKITVKSAILSAAAGKTLGRLFMKDPKIRAVRLTDPKHVTESTRAGRIWRHRPKGTCQDQPAVGDSAQVLATVDVIRDLKSVARYVDIK